MTKAFFSSYSFYEYEGGPLLVFLRLPEKLSAEQKVALFEYLEFDCYGNTGQETPDFALELQLWFRMVLDGSYLMITPRHLEMDSAVVDDICKIIGEGNADVYIKCVNNQELLNEIAAWVLTDRNFLHTGDIAIDLDTYECVY